MESYLQHPQVDPGHAGLPLRLLQEVQVGQPNRHVALEAVLQDLEELVDPDLDPALDLGLLVLVIHVRCLTISSKRALEESF